MAQPQKNKHDGQEYRRFVRLRQTVVKQLLNLRQTNSKEAIVKPDLKISHHYCNVFVIVNDDSSARSFGIQSHKAIN